MYCTVIFENFGLKAWFVSVFNEKLLFPFKTEIRSSTYKDS